MKQPERFHKSDGSGTSFHAVASPLVQSKLQIGKPDDQYEKEADAVADKVMSMSSAMPDPPMSGNVSPAVSMMPVSDNAGLQMKCSECEKEEQVQMEPDKRSKDHVASPEFSKKLQNTKGQGAGLSAPVNQEMSSKIGGDFSGVRIHTDGNAVQMSNEIGAKAFTHGNDIYFNQGEYAPGNSAGKHLLAHELTHVVQQGAHGNSVAPKIQLEMVQDRDGTLTFATEGEAQQRLDNLIRLVPDPDRPDHFFIEWRWDTTRSYQWTRGNVPRPRAEAQRRLRSLMRIAGGGSRWYVEKDDSLRPGGSADTSRSDAPRADAPRADAPRTEAPRTEAPRTEPPRTETQRPDAPRTAAPQTGPAVSGSPSASTAPTCRRFERATQRIITRNPRRYPAGVTMESHIIAAGENFTTLAESTFRNNTVTVVGQLADELRRLNTHVRPTALRPGDCVLVLRNWTHPNIGTLPSGVTSATPIASLPADVKRAIATVYAEQWNTGADSQRQQLYIWYSMVLRVTTSLRGPTLGRVLTAREFHGIRRPLFAAAMRELNRGTLSSPGLINAKDAVLNNYSTTPPPDAGVFYFHWLRGSSSQRCFVDRERAATRSGGTLTANQSAAIESACAREWAVSRDWDAGLPTSEGWHKKIPSDSGDRIQSMYIYRGF